MEEQISHATVDATAPRYVGFWLRFVAFIIDSIWTSIVIGIVIALLFNDAFMALAELPPDASPEELAAAMSAMGSTVMVETLLFAVLIIGFWLWKCATPGKMLISAEIADAKTLGKPSAGQLIIRYIGYIISTVVLMLGFLWIAIDSRKQGWHDKIAGTIVVRVR